MSEQSGQSWLGIDLGTQSVRALIVGDQGQRLGSGTVALTSRRDGSRHEQDPDSWWSGAVEAVRAALSEAGQGTRVSSVAVTGTSGSITVLDRDGRPLVPGLMYDDGRAAAYLDEVNRVGAADWSRAGYHRMQRSWALPKLIWLLHEHPDLVSDGGRLAHQVDVINRGLIGHDVAADTSNALKTGVDAESVGWPQETMSALGVPEQMLPDVVLPGTVLGTVDAVAAEATGLPAGISVIAGMTDGCAAQLGSGAVEVGSWNSVLGTTLVLKGVTDELLQDPAGVVYSHRSPSGHWLPGGASSVGAGLLSREFESSEFDALTQQAGTHFPTQVLRYPLVSPGERFPFVAADAHDFTIGDAVDRGEAFAAVLQGVAYAERLCLDYLGGLGAPTGGRLVLTGGATRNRAWTQLRADVLGRPVELPRSAEAVQGMAVLAAAASRGVRIDQALLDAARAMVQIESVVEPRPGSAGQHEEGYQRLVTALTERGWLEQSALATSTQTSTTQTSTTQRSTT